MRALYGYRSYRPSLWSVKPGFSNQGLPGLVNRVSKVGYAEHEISRCMDSIELVQKCEGLKGFVGLGGLRRRGLTV